jgi:mRNA interferase YafQ
MLSSDFTGQFGKDYKLMEKRRYAMAKIDEIIDMILRETPLPVRCREHLLHGNYEGKLECHITPDWLLIYKKDVVEKKVVFHRTGTHSDLF